MSFLFSSPFFIFFYGFIDLRVYEFLCAAVWRTRFLYCSIELLILLLWYLYVFIFTAMPLQPKAYSIPCELFPCSKTQMLILLYKILNSLQKIGGNITLCLRRASITSWYVCILPVCAISVPTLAVIFLWSSSDILSVFISLSSILLGV
jgi:hypothetical protein